MLILLLTLLQQPVPAAAQTPSAYQTGPGAPAYRVAPEAGAASASAAPPPELARTGVTLESYDASVERRWGAEDPFYTGAIRGGAALAQSRQGPLDGGWTVTGANGAALYAFQLVDTGEGGVEGAWRRPAGAMGSSGFIALISREPGAAVLRFLEPGASAPTVVSVRPGLDGSWRGEVARAGEPPAAVVMRRR